LAIEAKDEPIGPLVDEVLETARPAAADAGISLRTEVDRSLVVHVDRAPLLQVFGNLIGNAIKFCSAGDSVTIRAEPRGRQVVFAVTDTGPGIPPEDVKRIFDPYWSGQRHARKGTGLGLYITKGIVEAHGGRIRVKSEPGSGTTFFFPMAVGAAAASATRLQ
jgi:signal transduction histidine kinase